jgi:hypothetical protein
VLHSAVVLADEIVLNMSESAAAKVFVTLRDWARSRARSASGLPIGALAAEEEALAAEAARPGGPASARFRNLEMDPS